MHLVGYAVPPLTPVIALGVAVAGLLLCVPVARGLRTSPAGVAVAAVLIGGFTGATLAPTSGLPGTGVCSLSVHVDLHQDQQLLNVLLLVPLAVLVGSRSRRARAAVVLLSLVLPLAVEIFQRELPSLNRACDLVDVADGYLGVLVGAAIGLAGGSVRRARRASGTEESRRGRPEYLMEILRESGTATTTGRRVPAAPFTRRTSQSCNASKGTVTGRADGHAKGQAGVKSSRATLSGSRNSRM